MTGERQKRLSSRLAALAACLAGALVVGSCVSNAIPPSVWPPIDFELMVSGVIRDAAGRRVEQRFRVQSDGLAVYREARRAVPGTALDLPIFSSVSVYRLRPESVRIFGRKLERAGLFERSVVQSTNRDDEGEHVALRWSLFGGGGEISSFVDTGGSLDRIVHVVNSFLPEGHAFGFTSLSGEPEPSSLVRVPAPQDTEQGALVCHRRFAQTWVDEPGLLLDLFALAWAQGDVDTATRAVDDVVALGPIAPGDDLLSMIEWEQDCVLPLRDLLASMPPPAGDLERALSPQGSQ